MIGYAVCGSFCTLKSSFEALKELVEKGYDILPIMSETCYSTDTRFGKAADTVKAMSEICRRDVIHSIAAAEPIGPKGLLEALIISPCTGNTLAKIVLGVTDSAVTMAAKAHLRNERPLILAIATNDALSANLKNIGHALERKQIYLVPFGQDDPHKKPSSMIADFSLTEKTLEAALTGKQIQPILI